MVDSETTGMVLYQLPILSPDTEPFCFLACPNTEKLLISFRCISLSTYNVLYLFTEVIIICNWSNWIPTQSIDICMPEPWSVYYLEAKILQHVYPPSSPAMRI
jgi:hypothetical protein